MSYLIRVALVSMTVFLAACSSAQKKSDPTPVVVAPAATAEKPMVPVQAVKPAKPIHQLLCEHGTD